MENLPCDAVKPAEENNKQMQPQWIWNNSTSYRHKCVWCLFDLVNEQPAETSLQSEFLIYRRYKDCKLHLKYEVMIICLSRPSDMCLLHDSGPIICLSQLHLSILLLHIRIMKQCNFGTLSMRSEDSGKLAFLDLLCPTTAGQPVFHPPSPATGTCPALQNVKRYILLYINTICQRGWTKRKGSYPQTRGVLKKTCHSELFSWRRSCPHCYFPPWSRCNCLISHLLLQDFPLQWKQSLAFILLRVMR